jgi:hypothetical protein
MDLRVGVIFALSSLLGVQVARGQGGTFPPDPFNGMQTTYSVSGADVTASEDHPGFTWSRAIKGTLKTGTLRVSGSAKMGSGFYADVKVTVTAGGKSNVWSSRIKSGSPGFNSESFNVSVPIPDGAAGGGFSIDMTGNYNAGSRGVVVSGEFTAPAGGSKGNNRGSSAGQNQKTVGFDGDYSGRVSSNDANAASGRLQFTVSGNSVHGTVAGQWAGAVQEGEQKQLEESAYSATFSGTVDPNSGRFSSDMAGKIGDVDFAGHLRGQIQGNDGRGTWDAGNEWSKSSGTWSASRPQPLIPGPSSSTDQSTDIIDSPPPGLTNVGDVPGPANLPETGTSIVLPGLLAATTIGIKALLDSRVTPPPVVDYGPADPDTEPPDASDDSTPQADSSPAPTLVAAPADSSSSAAPQPAPITSEYGPEHAQAIQDWQDSSDKYEAMKKQLADFEQGADKTSPQYDALKKQYTDYLDYYKQKADNSSAQADAIAQAVEQDRNTQSLTDSQGNVVKQVVYDPKTGQWYDRETHNIFDPDKWQQTQDQAAKDQAWSQTELDRMAAHRDSFSQQMDQMAQDQKRREAAEQYLNRIGQEAINRGLWNPGGPGDVYGKTRQLVDDLYQGKPIDGAAINQVRHLVNDCFLGRTADESILARPENQDRLVDAAATAFWNTARETITGKGVDGKPNSTVAWASTTALRFGLAVETGLKSEALYSYLNGLYAANDSYQGGATWGQAAVQGSLTTAWEAAPTVLGLVGAHALPKIFPNVSAGIGEMMEPAQQFGNRLTQQATRAVDAATTRAKLFASELSGNLSAEGREAMLATRTQAERALATSDPAELAKLYSDGGMRRLGDLQAQGGLTNEEARALNAKLSPLVKDSVDAATRQTMTEFEERTGVKIEETILGDSGSSARKTGNPNARTDHDITNVTRLNQANVAEYARKNGLSTQHADEELKQLLNDRLADNIDNQMRVKGFSRGANDVDCKVYSGIGSGAGQADSYGYKFTGLRQGVSGEGTRYVTGEGGGVVSNKISGQAVVDQNGLNVRESTGTLPEDPTKFTPDEFKGFSQQQMNAVKSHTDVKSVAKALGRESQLADRMEHMTGSDYSKGQLTDAGLPASPPKPSQELKDLMDIANSINQNPSGAIDTLRAYGYNESTFQAAAQRHMGEFNTAIVGKS